MEERKKSKFIFTGRRIAQDGILYHEYKILTEDPTEASLASFSIPLGTSKRGRDVIGGVYTGEYDGSRAYGRWVFERKIEGDEVVNWEAKDLEAEAVRKANKAKDESSELSMYSALRPIREAYRKTNTLGRRAILSAVIEYICR